MIEAIGVDIVKNKRIKLDTNFLKKFLHPNEIILLNSFESKKRKIEFASGRWAIKEAIIKSCDLIIKMNEINIIYLNNKPIIEGELGTKIHISISHESDYSIGFAIKEKK